MKNKFNTGQIVATPGALRLEEDGCDLVDYLNRHLSGDWGNLCKEDTAENDLSLTEGNRLLSSYNTPYGKLWIITEADRSATTFLTPSEY